MADGSNNLNPYRQQRDNDVMALARQRYFRSRIEHSQPQPPNRTIVQNLGSTAHQSHQLYTVQPRAQVQYQPQASTQSNFQSYQATEPTTKSYEYLNYIHESLVKSSKCLETLLSSVASIRETLDGLTKKTEAHERILEKLEKNSCGDEKTKAKEVEVTKVLAGEMKAFKKTLGKSCDGDDGRTVLGRLDAVTFMVGELLERARDPEANLPDPSASGLTVVDLTMSSPPPVGHTGTSPMQNRTYVDTGTSPVPSPLPLEGKSFSSVLAGTSSQPISECWQSPAQSTPNPSRSHSLVNDTITIHDTGTTSLTQETLELASMDVDTVDSTEPTLNFLPSDNPSSTTTKAPHVEASPTVVHSVAHSDLASPKNVQTTKHIPGSGESAHKDRSADGRSVLNMTPDSKPGGVPTFKHPYTFPAAVAPTSSASLAFTTTPAEVQRPADKTIATLMVSVARLKNPYLGMIDFSASDGKQQQKEGSQKQALPEQLELPLANQERLSHDNMNSERSTIGPDDRDHSEEKIRATQGASGKKEEKEETKEIEEQVLEVDENRNSVVSVPALGLIGLNQRPASPFTSLTSLNSTDRAGSRLSMGASEDISVSSRLSSDTKLHSPTKTRVLVGTGASRSPGPVAHAAVTPATASSSASVTTSNGTRTPISASLSPLFSRDGVDSRLSIDHSEDISVSSTSSDAKLYSSKSKVLVSASTSRSPGPVVRTTATSVTTSPAVSVATSNSGRTSIPTSLSPLSSRDRAGSKVSIDPSEDISISRDTKLYSPTKSKVLVGASTSTSRLHGPVIRTATTSAAASAAANVTTSNSTRTLVASPVKKATSSQSVIQPTATSEGLAAAPSIQPTIPVTIFATPAIFPVKKTIPTAPESSPGRVVATPTTPAVASVTTSNNTKKLTTTPINKASSVVPSKLAPTIRRTTPATIFPSTVISSAKKITSPVFEPSRPAATFSISATPTQNSSFAASSGLDHLVSPSHAPTNATQNEMSVRRMVIDEDVSQDENLADKTATKTESKMTSHNFEEEVEERHLFLSSLSSLSPSPFPASVSGSRPAKVSVQPPPPQVLAPSTPRPRSDLSFTLLPTPQPMPTQTRSPIETLLPRNISPIPDVEKEKEKAKEVERQTSLDDGADVARAEKRELSEGSSMKNAESKEGELLSLKSPLSNRQHQVIILTPSDDEGQSGTASAVITTTFSKTTTPTPTQTSIEISLPRDLSPISSTRNEKAKDKMQVSNSSLRKRYTSLGDDADIVRATKRKVLEGSRMTEREPSLEKAGPAAKGKGSAKKEDMDSSEILTSKTGADAKRPSLLNLKGGKKGESIAVTRIKKRKARSDFVDGEVEGEHDELDQEKPLKRARQRISERQIKMEQLDQSKRLTRELSGSSFGTGTSTRVMKPRSSASASVKTGPPSKGRLSARGQGKAEVEWPTVTKGNRAEDLVGCDNCSSWYHYGCVGLAVGDARLRNGKKFFCPPCEAGITIKKHNTDTECRRPNCTVPPGFVVEKIIGRFKKFVGGQGLQFRYLLQWKGYSLSESSWEPEESMFDPPFMIEKFRVDALEEGIDIDKDKNGLILLRAAKDPSVPRPTVNALEESIDVDKVRNGLVSLRVAKCPSVPTST